MQSYIIFFIIVKALHVSRGLSAHHQELKFVLGASGICQTCFLLPLAWMLAVAANKSDKYPMLHVQIWAPDDERKDRLKHVELWQ
jgi:hypothetical protein